MMITLMIGETELKEPDKRASCCKDTHDKNWKSEFARW